MYKMAPALPLAPTVPLPPTGSQPDLKPLRSAQSVDDDSYTGISAGVVAAVTNYTRTVSRRTLELMESHTSFEYAITNFETEVANSDISPQEKQAIQDKITDVKKNVSTKFAKLNFDERETLLIAYSTRLGGINKDLNPKLKPQYFRAWDAFTDLQGASVAASRWTIGYQALSVGAVGGLAAGLASCFFS